MFEALVYSTLGVAPLQGAALVRKDSSDCIVQVGGMVTKKDRNHPPSHYLQLRILNIPSATWSPQAVVTNGYFNRAYHACAVLGEDIYVFGGENVAERNVCLPLQHFQQAESDILKISKGFFGYKTVPVSSRTEVPAENLALVGHTATVVRDGDQQYVILFGGFVPSLSGKAKLNTDIYIFGYEDVLVGGEEDHHGGSRELQKIATLKVLETDPAAPNKPAPRAFHTAHVLSTAADSDGGSCQILIQGGQSVVSTSADENKNSVLDDFWLLDLTAHLAYLRQEALLVKQKALEPVAPVAAAPTGKGAKETKKDTKKDDKNAPPPKPAAPYVQWIPVTLPSDYLIENETSGTEEAKGNGEVTKDTKVQLKRSDHTLSLWPLTSDSNADTEGTKDFQLLLSGGYRDLSSSGELYKSANAAVLYLRCEHSNTSATLSFTPPIFKAASTTANPRLTSSRAPTAISSWRPEVLHGSRAMRITAQDVLNPQGQSTNDPVLEAELASLTADLIADDEAVAVLVCGGHVSFRPSASVESPWAQSAADWAPANHHLRDLSATISASRTITTILPTDPVTVSAMSSPRYQQQPRSAFANAVDADDNYDEVTFAGFVDRTLCLLSADETDDASHNSKGRSKEDKQRQRQRQAARDYLRRVANGREDPVELRRRLLDQLRRANTAAAALHTEHRRIVYRETGDIYEGDVVSVAALQAVSSEDSAGVDPAVAEEARLAIMASQDGVVPHGEGRMEYAATGNVYEGQWRRGQRHGRGEFVDQTAQTKYTGDFRANRRHGSGITVDTNNKSNTSNGHGEDNKELQRPRWEHRGTYQEDVFHGDGRFVDFRQQLIYSGPFVRGLKQGTGRILRLSDAAIANHHNSSNEEAQKDAAEDETLCAEGVWQDDRLVGWGTAYALPILSLNILKGRLPLSVMPPPVFDLSLAHAILEDSPYFVASVTPLVRSVGERHALFQRGVYAGPLFDGQAHTSPSSNNTNTSPENSTQKQGKTQQKASSSPTSPHSNSGQGGASEGVAIYSDGAVYTGQWKQGRRNGFGTYIFGAVPSNNHGDADAAGSESNSRPALEYRGKWVGDRRCGHGFLQYPAQLPFHAHVRCVYDGLWQENVYHGTGCLVDYDVDVVYEGRFQWGFKEGGGAVRQRVSHEDEELLALDRRTEMLSLRATLHSEKSPTGVQSPQQSPTIMPPTLATSTTRQSQEWIHDHTVYQQAQAQQQRAASRMRSALTSAGVGLTTGGSNTAAGRGLGTAGGVGGGGSFFESQSQMSSALPSPAPSRGANFRK